MSSGEQPEFSSDIYSDLKEHLRAKDQDGAIELINQLLSCGRPLGEIIAEIMPHAAKPDSSGPVTSDSLPPDAAPTPTGQADLVSVAPDTSELVGHGTTQPAGLSTLDRLKERTGGITAYPFAPSANALASDQSIEPDPAAEPMPAAHDQGDLAIPAAPYASGTKPRQQDRDERRPFRPTGSRNARMTALCLAAAVGSAAIAVMFLVPRTFEVETIASKAQASFADRTPAGAAPGGEATKAATTGIAPQDEAAAILTIASLKFEPEAPSPAALPVAEARSLDAMKTAPDSTPAEDQAPTPAAVSNQSGDSTAILERGSNSPTGFEPASDPVAVMEPVSAPVMEPAMAAVMEPSANSAVAGGPATDATDQATVSQIVAPTPEATPQRRAASGTEIAAMMSRGDALLTTGDITSARLFYRYGADAGDGTAALRLGATFDPAFLAQARLSGVSGDPAKAAHWYRRAHDLGNAEADILLKSLEPTRK